MASALRQGAWVNCFLALFYDPTIEEEGAHDEDK